jgi:hypothetical protein
VRGTITYVDGSTEPFGEEFLLQPLEGGLRALSWGIVILVAGIAVARFG